VTTFARWLALVLALASACAFAMSVWVGTWWTIGEVTIGPFGARACMGGDCQPRGLAWLGGSDLWMRSAVATGVAGVIAMFLAVTVAGALAARRHPRLLARSMLVAIATAVVTGGYFIFGIPQVGDVTPQIALGIPLYIVGAVLGIAAAVVAARAPQLERS
jgi:hypothetical protein